MPEAKGRDSHIQFMRADSFGEVVLDHVSQRVHRMLRRIDNVVGEVANLRKHFALLADRVEDILIRQRMWPTSLAVTPQQNVVVRFQKQNRNVNAFILQLPIYPRKQAEELARTHVDNKSRPIDFFGFAAKPDKGRNELNRQVVDREVTEVLKRLEGG